jgi:hypothetical protein
MTAYGMPAGYEDQEAYEDSQKRDAPFDPRRGR